MATVTSQSNESLNAEIVKPCPISAQKWKTYTHDVFDNDGGTTFCVNPNPAYNLSDNEVSYKIDRVFRRCIQRYINIHFGDLPEDARPRYPKLRMVAVGEHAVTGKYHFHGIFRGIPNDMVDLIKKSLQRTLGRTEITMCRNIQAYVEYMYKSYGGEGDEENGEYFDTYDVINIGCHPRLMID